MRVAIFSETFLPKIDGIVRVACLTLEHLQRRGIEAILLAPTHDIHEYAGVEVIPLPNLPLPMYPEVRMSFPHLGTYRRVKQFKPDLIHVFHPLMAGLAGLTFARRLKVPTIASFHLDMARIIAFYRLSLLQPSFRRATRWTFNLADYALAPSKLVQTDMKHLGVRKVGLWRRGVDAEQFNPRFRDSDMRAALSDGHPDETILIYVGRLAAEKQIQQLRAVLEAVPGTRLALVGGGPYREALEKHFAGLPVKFMGYLRGEALAQAYASADLFVFPSAFESFGLVLLESMASSVPVVSSRVGGAQDMVEEGVSGYTFAVNDTTCLVDYVKEMVTTPGKLKEMGLAARRAAELLSWPHIMDELVSCYEAIIAGQPSPI